MIYKTEQEKFWATEFGDDYSERNQGSKKVASNINLFCNIFQKVGQVRSLIEFGSNRGLNLQAISNILPEAQLSAVEINSRAVDALEKWGGCTEIFNQSALDFVALKKYEVALIKGVLIHINPDELPTMYERLYSSSSRWIIVVEYYNPTPVEINYRGHSNRLFKRDFAGEILDKYPDLRLVNYGFVYRRDLSFPQDDITWFLMEKC